MSRNSHPDWCENNLHRISRRPRLMTNSSLSSVEDPSQSAAGTASIMNGILNLNRRRLLLSVLLSFTVMNGLDANPRTQSSAREKQVLSGAEFPDYDAEILRAQRNGMLNNSLSGRLKREPGIPELADLLQQDRVDEAITLLRLIIRSTPQNIPAAFQVVVEHPGRFSDVARGYPDSLQQLVDAARMQLSQLSREEGARAERQMLLVDRSVAADQRRSTVDRLRPFVQQYAGTETALLTEVDVIEFGLPIRQQLTALDAVVLVAPLSR